MSTTGNASRRIAQWLVSHPVVCAVVLLALVGASVEALTRLTIESGTAPFFDKERAERKALDSLEAKFVAEDTIFVSYEAKSVFSHEALEAVRRISAELESISVKGPKGEPQRAVAEVLSLTTVKDVFGEEGGFEMRPLVGATTPTDPEALRQLAVRARRNPMIAKNLLPTAGDDVAGMAVRIEPGLADGQRAELLNALRELLDRQQGFTFHLAGEIVTAAESALQMKRDLARFIPIVYSTVALILVVLLRRLVGVLLAMLNVTVSLLVGFGVLKWVGGSINNLSTALPPLMLVLAVSTVVHFLSELAKTARVVADPRAAAIETIAELLPPQFFCALTTAVGFACLGISNVKAMQEFGAAAGIAVMISLCTEFMLVALAANLARPDRFVAPESPATAEWFRRFIERYADWVTRNTKAVFALSVVIFLGVGSGAFFMVADENMLEHFGTSSRVRQDTDFLERRMAGSMVVVVSVESREPGYFERPEALARLEALTHFMEQQPGVDEVTSVVDAIKLMHRGVEDEADASFTIPETRAQVAQLLTMNTDDRIRQFLDSERRHVRLMARSHLHGANELNGLYGAIDGYLAREFPQPLQTLASGSARMYVFLVDDIVGSQINTLWLSFLLIFGPIFLLFRSWTAGAYTIPSNVYPVALSFGIMGWSGIHLNMATTMTASIVLGIAVDDTIHFIEGMRRRLSVHGDTQRALRETLELKGVGVFSTTLIITCGFAVLLTSGYSQTREFGLLTGVAMITGALGELLMLPPLMLLMNTKLGTVIVPGLEPSAPAASPKELSAP